MAKNCPRCKLVNPSEAQRCDCGYDFQSQQMKRSYLQPKQLKTAAAVTGGSIAALFIYLGIIRGIPILLKLLGIAN